VLAEGGSVVIVRLLLPWREEEGDSRVSLLLVAEGGGGRSATASLAVYWRWAAFCWPRAVTALLFDCCCLDGRRRATWRPHRSLCPRPSTSRSRPSPTRRPPTPPSSTPGVDKIPPTSNLNLKLNYFVEI